MVKFIIPFLIVLIVFGYSLQITMYLIALRGPSNGVTQPTIVIFVDRFVILIYLNAAIPTDPWQKRVRLCPSCTRFAVSAPTSTKRSFTAPTFVNNSTSRENTTHGGTKPKYESHFEGHSFTSFDLLSYNRSISNLVCSVTRSLR